MIVLPRRSSSTAVSRFDCAVSSEIRSRRQVACRGRTEWPVGRAWMIAA
jgi:hypothetical protein